VACEDRPGAGLRGLLRALARLATAGVALRTGWLFEGRGALDAETAPRPTRPGWTVDGHLVRTADGACLPGGLAPARRISLEGTVIPEPTAASGASQTSADALLADFLRTSREMVAAQRDVMLAYLGATPGARIVLQDAPASGPAFDQHRPEPRALTSAPQQAVAVEATGTDILGTVLEIISVRTGYPRDMIEPDLDLEADLSVDSIKRTEIAGELAKRLDLGAADLDDDQYEQMAKARTARAIAAWLSQHLDGANGSEPVTSATEDPGASTLDSAGAAPFEDFAAEPEPDIRAPQRIELREIESPLPEAPEYGELAGKRFALLGTDEAGPLAEAVVAQLAAHGVSVEASATAQPPSTEPSLDGVLYFGGLTTSEQPLLPGAFAEIKAALANPPQWFFALRPIDATGASAGLRGLMRTIDREYPQTIARLVEIDPAGPAEQTAALLISELLSGDRHPVVIHRGSRLRLDPVETPLGALAVGGAGPAGDGVSEAQALGLDRDSVVVIVGGARGITARIASTLAGAARCRLELIGRTPLPTEPEPPATAAALDAAALRAALIAGGMRAPAEIERTIAATLAAREVANTLQRLRDLGARPRYHALDVRDGAALRQLLKDIHAEHGRLDGVVYAAGIIEDKVIADKAPESFARVFATKADGARALFAGLDHLPEPPRFSVLFGSIAAVFGNRGQSDYAAANDALESLGAAWAARTGARCLTVHWGPWAPSAEHGGMVTPELMQAYAKRGIALIDPEDGALALLRELAWGGNGTAVVYTASGW
jgi:NAD(P)-dependent dehydrogenase (short-subunit alcohol dehydrogenase family)/acyl carrier protein